MGITSSLKKIFGLESGIPTTVQQTIPYERVHDHGIIESAGGLFSKAYSLEDINFSIAPDDEQKQIFFKYEDLLNSFATTTPFQIIIHNYKADKLTTLRTIKFLPQRDGLNKFRNEMNRVLSEKLSIGNNSLRQKKYLVVTNQDNNADQALTTLRNIDENVRKAVQGVAHDVKVEYETVNQRLETLFNIFHKNGQGTFGNSIDSKGNHYIDFKAMKKQGLGTKDLIGPESFKFEDNYFMIGEKYARVFFMESYPTFLTTDFISDLANINAEMLISMNYEPIEPAKALKTIRDQLMNLNAEMSEKQKNAAKEGYSVELISPELSASRDAMQELLHDVIKRDQKMFMFTFLVTIFADSKEELVEITRQIASVSNNTHKVQLKTLTYQQEDGFNACLPLGVNKIKAGKMLTTEASSIFIPYTSQELHQRNGIYYGLNKITNNLIMYDRLGPRVHNYNGLIIGESGSGKSYTAKCEMMAALLRSDKNKVYIIDPQSEYHKMALNLHGEIIELSAQSKTFINPFDMDIDYSGENDPVSMKSDYLMGMIEIMMGENHELTAKEKSLIDRCVKNIYRGYLIHMDELRRRHEEAHLPGKPPTNDRSATPTLANLYNELRQQPEEEAHNLASTIEIYTQGSLATFAHRTNVNTSKNLVVYDIRNLGSGMNALGLHICLNDIWNKMFENFYNGYTTWIYIDEFYLLLRNASATQFLMEMWKLARKWRGVPTGIMQNTEDLLNSPATKNIVGNTNFIMALSLKRMDRTNLGELIQVSESQLDYIDNSPKGHGLIYTSDTVLPFNNEYPTDTEMHQIMNTSR